MTLRGGATLGRDPIVADGRSRSTPSAAGRVDEGLTLVEKKQMEWKRRKDIREREDLESRIECMEIEEEDDGVKRMPPSKIVKHHDLLEKTCGWDWLLPFRCVSWPDYSNYLEEYYSRNAEEHYRRNCNAATGSRTAALADICLRKEEQLASEWKNLMRSKVDMMLPSKTIVLSCLIHERARSVICTDRDGGEFFSDDVFSAALLCISKEAELTCEFLRRGASPRDDCLIEQSSEIRMCALGLMNCCTSCLSVAASAAMLGAAKEAEIMLGWMSENNMLLDFYDDDSPLELDHCRVIRIRTLYAMIDILLKCSFSSAGGGANKIDFKEESASVNGHSGDGNGGIAADEAANVTGGGISDVLLNPQVQKKIIKDSARKDFLEKLWGWERLFPFSSSIQWSDYCDYLEEYYHRNALKFVAEATASQNNPDWGLV